MDSDFQDRHPVLRPPLAVLCGSLRFKEQFFQAGFDLTRLGYIVLQPGWASPKLTADASYTPGPEEKRFLDELHFRRIDIADLVVVVNIGGYVGESTRNEVAYAREHGRPVWFLVVEGVYGLPVLKTEPRPA